MKKKFKKALAFTLAEVLITLSILGVVAAITVPSLIKRQHEREYITKVKKNVASINNAINTAIAENGLIETWPISTNDELLDKMSAYFNYTKKCYVGDDSCAGSDTYKTLNPDVEWGHVNFNETGTANLVLKDGTLIGFSLNKSNIDFIVSIKFDINGDKKPNQLGVDTFDLSINSKEGVRLKPWDDQIENWDNNCNIESSYEYNGASCTLWVIAKGNMDYRRKTTSW